MKLVPEDLLEPPERRDNKESKVNLVSLANLALRVNEVFAVQKVHEEIVELKESQARLEH